MKTSNFDSMLIASKIFPGGVNSPVRSFYNVGGTPFFTASAKDSYLYDVEGNKYIDYVCSWGANIVGHANDYVNNKIIHQLHNGLSFGTPSEIETKLATIIKKLVPSIEKLRLVNSGTEAVMSAIRVARGYTNKNLIIKFDGCYHGHCDSLLIKSGSGLATFNNEGLCGVTKGSVLDTLVIEYNNIEILENTFHKYAHQIAAVIIEPIAGNMNFIRPTMKFLNKLQSLCKNNNSLLIFDEVMTGFRVSLGGAQQLFNIIPDITILGKVVGGGLPLAAFGGKSIIMDCLSPNGAVYQAGTLSGNPIAASSGIATLELIQQQNFYDKLNESSFLFCNGIIDIAHKHGFDVCYDYQGGMFGFYFNNSLPNNFDDVKKISNNIFNKLFHLLLAKGIFLPPSMFESCFISITHDQKVINNSLDIINESFKDL